MASATPSLLLCNAKASNCWQNKAFKNLGHYSEWPKVADAELEAEHCSSFDAFLLPSHM